MNIYKLIGSPVLGVYTAPKWYKYIIPRRLTGKYDSMGKKQPAIYCWLGFNFSW